MGLDFYIAKSKDIVNSKKVLTEFDDFVSLHEELQEYIYTNSSIIDFEINCLMDIDPYADTLLENEKITQISKVCEYILESDFLQKYEDVDDAINIFLHLDKLCKKAISENKSLIAIGD
ncbi:hypothetical protein [Lachnotalea glycerini]|uniref:Uncharacterized protein n=1 Tax=Lachnotalea glycerini TaxID=1763509 RepID=A0A371J254_9FIRM|nr:hypothetical protein [Lachnotalea glycerini]RDY26892.1 hypothetical protein CG710_021305 [Lachnotalea glycerini]